MYGNSRFGLENVVQEATNKMIEHVGSETIQAKQFPGNFKHESFHSLIKQRLEIAFRKIKSVSKQKE